MRSQSTVLNHLTVRALVVLLLTTLLPALVTAGVASAAGPSVGLPPTKSVAVTSPTLNAPPQDAASDSAMSGNHDPRAEKEGAGSSRVTTLSPSSSWGVSEQTGDFTTGYPLRVPPVPGGLTPKLELSYRSSAVDGRTSIANNQPSWIGEGWDLSPGFVERTYGNCAEDDTGGTKPPQVGDLCWRSDNATASFDGGSGMLIRDDSANPEVWRAKNDSGARIERQFRSGVNPDNDGEHWKITTADGTQYFFGSEPDSSATWTVPVFGDDVNEPCHASTFDASKCTQAWRWNLDKVIDRNGNMIRYFYETETNKYGLNLKDTGVEYVRAGVLKRIDYGLHKDLGTPPSGRVEFTTADRCLPGSVCDMNNKDHWGNWPDTPLDMRCVTDTCPKLYGPSFWSTKRLASITTQVLSGGSPVEVDRWELDQQYPDPGDGERAALWLKGIKHVGLAGERVELPWIRFIGSKFPNRVEKIDGVAPLNRYRITGIMSETGGITSITYAQPDCAASSLPENAWTNTKRCFPVTWAKRDHVERTDYFHKYVVDTVVQSDRLNTSTPQVTSYEYIGGAAWHWDRSEFTKDDKKTWNEYRGFGKVRTRAGSDQDTTPVTMTEKLFHRGMDGDRLNRDGGTKPVAVKDSEGVDRTDHERLHGVEYESRAFERSSPRGSTDPDPPLTSKTITDMWSKGPTAKRGSFEAYIVRPSTTRKFIALKPDGMRQTKSETTYDEYGLPLDVNDLGDVSTNTDDQCTRTRYARNLDAWLLNLVSTTETVSVDCGTSPVFPQHAVSDTRTSYDDLDFGATPIKGNPSKVEVAKDRPAAGPVYVTASRAKHDSHGRITEAIDAAGSLSKTIFTPLTGGPVTKIEQISPPTAVSPRGMLTTTLLDPALGLPTLVTDANSRVTETKYDALGRTVEVWLANRPRAKNPQGSLKVSYQIRDDKPSVVTSWKIGPNGIHTASKTVYDGLLRPRQTQTPAVGQGRLITDTKYDSHGRVYKTTQPYFNDAPLDDELWEASDTEIPGHTRTEFDDAGRPKASVYYTGATEKWRSTNEYGGDRVHVTPPNGGTASTTIRDARDRVTELRQYHAPTPTGTYDTTTYKYGPAGYLSEVVSPGNAVWRFGYDLRGNKIRAEDPDTGVSTMTYDDAGRMATTTDARGTTLAHVYDSLSRKTATHQGTTNGPKIAEWVYDTAGGGKGQLASSTRFVTVDAQRHAYTTSVGSYTEMYQPNSSTVTIPAVEGLLAGKYTWYGGYDWDGSLSGEAYPAAGGLQVEDVNYVYDHAGRLLSSSGSDGNGTVELVTNTLYTRYGEPERIQFGAGTKRVWLSNYYDSHTRLLERSIVDVEATQPMQSDVRYTYNDAGYTTSLAEAAPGQGDTQCFRHDHVGRLTEAWTPTGACAEPSTTLGGTAPYWHSYKYDKSGNRTEETWHTSTGNTVKTYDYPNPATPHRLRAVNGGTAPETLDYDASGNTIKRTKAGIGETLNWDAEGHLESVTKGGKTTSFIYNAEGARLLRKDPDGTTLYLGNQEVRLSASGGSPVATRYYTYGGNIIAVRVGSKLTWVAGNQRATQVSIDSRTMQVTRRQQLPFGAPRGTAPAFWPDERGFVGGTLDSSTGLTHLGAREYDTSLGRFISVDPLMDLTDPLQMQGYAYANNSPITLSDPTGLKPAGCEEERLNCRTGEPLPPTNPDHFCDSCNNGEGRASRTQPPPKERVKKTVGVTQIRADSWDIWTKGWLAAMAKHKADGWNDLLPYCIDPDLKPGACMGSEWLDVGKFREYFCAEDGIQCPENMGSGGQEAAGSLIEAGMVAGGGAVGSGGRGAAGKLSNAACSFDGDTEVLMADGTTKPIAEITKGDQVLAADPKSGSIGPQKVIAVMVHDDTVLDLVTVDGSTVTTTADHPFWNRTDREWQRADELDPGDQLLAPDGRQITVSGLKVGSARIAAAHNLTVAELHTYYVMVGNNAVLVHNSCPVLSRMKPMMEDGNSKHGWIHIDQRHVPEGAVPGKEQGSLFARGTTRDQITKAAEELVRKGTRQSDPTQMLQVYEGRMNINGLRTNYRVVINTERNTVHTMFPIG